MKAVERDTKNPAVRAFHSPWKSLKTGCLLIVVLIIANPVPMLPQDSSGIRLINTIPLPDVKGRIDHMDFDVKRDRLFVAALGNNTVEVINVRRGVHMRSITGIREPQGVAFLPETDRLVVSSGGDGEVLFFDADSFHKVKTLNGYDDADNVRYDASSKLIFVGYGGGGVAAIDAQTMSPEFTLPLSQHPEAFQLEHGSARMFVNVPNERAVVLLDRESRLTLTKWILTTAESNFPMALDERTQTLFVGFRDPPTLQSFDARTGSFEWSQPLGGDVDDIFCDQKRGRVYASCGSGELDVFSRDGDRFTLEGKVSTRRGARTSLFVPSIDLLLVAVPRSADAAAEIRVYAPQVRPKAR